MCEEEKFPENFENTTIHIIFKDGNERREKLSENCFIHSKSWLPRIFEACVVEGELKGHL